MEYDFVEYIYIINLDHEVLTMNHGIHWKLGNIPRPHFASGYSKAGEAIYSSGQMSSEMVGRP
jgi:hypothetical protein